MLKPYYQKELIEVGCDEAGRGCLAGPVVAAAVLLPKDYKNIHLNDSKQISKKQRDFLRLEIEKEALDFSVQFVDNNTIDEINILQASVLAMHKCLNELKQPFEFIIIDGNYFKPYKSIKHKTIIKGDSLYMSIAAASILAKTHRDEWMEKLDAEFPQYHWKKNKGYATAIHRQAVKEYGHSPFHRKSFHLKEMQMNLFGNE